MSIWQSSSEMGWQKGSSSLVRLAPITPATATHPFLYLEPIEECLQMSLEMWGGRREGMYEKKRLMPHQPSHTCPQSLPDALKVMSTQAHSDGIPRGLLYNDTT
jgi:hypothetical protein